MSWKLAVIGTALVLSGSSLMGCVERRMVVRSDPDGAQLLLELDEIEGRTPVEIPFEFGGLRNVTLIKPGFKVLETTAELEDRWFAYFPLDFFAEVLWPGTIEDVQEFDFTLEAYEDYDESQDADNKRRIAELRERAEAHRRGGSRGPDAEQADAEQTGTKHADGAQRDAGQPSTGPAPATGAPLPRPVEPRPDAPPPPPPPPRVGK